MHTINRFLTIVRKPAIVAGLVVFALAMLLSSAKAQTGGEGAIEGTVLDASGAVVPNATVTATNVNTGVVTTRTATAAGFYTITPIIPGTYTVTVTAKGFQVARQENLVIDPLKVTGLNVHMKAGSQGETVTITDAPPALETTNATLGGSIDNNVYTALPIMIANLQQRDITQFSNLLPGAQVPPGGRSSIIGGTAQRIGELYVDGLPLTTASQQGDNRPVFNIVPLEAIDSIQVVTSGFSAEYQGAGLENYTTKSGGNQYHGSLFEYIRNTAFDTWNFSSNPCLVGCSNVQKVFINNVLTTIPGRKTPEHQNEYGFAVGGPINIPFLFSGHDKLFFFATFDKFQSYQGANASASTVPSSLMRKGDFRELVPVASGGLGNTAGVNLPIYDPTTQAACTAFNGTPCRYQYGYTHGATPGSPQVATGAPVNVIPAGELSPISQYMEQFLPAPTNDAAGVISNNFLGGLPQGFHNWLYSGRVDYNISERHHLSLVLTGGNRHAVPYTSTSTSNLPVPYLASTLSTVAGHWAELEDSYTFTPHLVNQFKYGFMNFGGPPVQNPTYGTPQYSAGATGAGITGLPAGQATDNFPIAAFSGANAPLPWANVSSQISGGSNSTSATSVSETYTVVDNVQWLKGRHSLNFGFQYQWLEDNSDSADTGSTPLTLPWGTNTTAQLTPSSWAPNTGYSYASYMIGGPGGSGSSANTSATAQPFSVVGARYHPFAPYFQDDFKVTPKLTLNIGLRWDYLPTFTEVQNRWSFLNPNITNPITGNLGALQFAGNYGGTGVSCNCRTPVSNWYKNFGPRLGFAYSVNDKTVIRGGYAIVYTHGGGTSGAGGAGVGTGQTGFSNTVNYADSTAGPAFYLNNNPAFPGGANANFGGVGATTVAPLPIGPNSQALNTGYYVCSGQPFAPCNGATNVSGGNGGSIAYADPRIGGRAPEIAFYNLGIQRELTKDTTITINYVGTQAHFLAGAGNLRGLQSNELNPIYLNQALGPYLNMPATATNLAAARTASGGSLPTPYLGYSAAAGVNTNATIAHMLTWMPQYNGVTDTWGTVANANYNAMQLSLNRRFSKGLTFTVNYTYSKDIDDAGTARSGFAIPATATTNGRSWKAARIDRSRSTNDLPQLLTIFGVYQLPFGKGHMGGDRFAVRAIASGWQLSEIFQYSSGLVLPLSATCNSTQNIGQGTCMPDNNPNFSGSPRINGAWGHGSTAANLGSLKFIQGYIAATGGGVGTSQTDGSAQPTGTTAPVCSQSVGPFCNTGNYAIGSAARTAPYNLRGQSPYRLTMALSRTFDITERFKFVFRVDCQNVTNHVTFGNNAQNNQVGGNVNNASFGTVGFASADSRAFQFSGRINF